MNNKWFVSRLFLSAFLFFTILTPSFGQDGDAPSGWPSPPDQTTPTVAPSTWPAPATKVPPSPTPPVPETPTPAPVPSVSEPQTPPPAPVEKTPQVLPVQSAELPTPPKTRVSPPKAPKVPFTFSSLSHLLQKDPAHRKHYWEMVSLIAEKNYSNAVDKALSIELKTARESENPATVVRKIRTLVQPGNTSDQRRYNQILTKIVSKVDNYLTQNQLSILSLENERPLLENLKKELPETVEKCQVQEGNTFLGQSKDKERISQSYLLANILVSLLINEATENQRYLKPPLPSEESIYEKFVALLRTKATQGVESVVPVELTTGPLIKNPTLNKIVFVLFLLLLLAIIPGTGYIIHKQTKAPAPIKEPEPEKEEALTEEEPEPEKEEALTEEEPEPEKEEALTEEEPEPEKEEAPTKEEPEQEKKPSS